MGYGLQSVKPTEQRALVRYTGDVMLVDVNGTNGIPRGTSVVFSNNPGQKATGGTCFGDSGGPVFWYGSNVMVAVVSYALNQNCKGTRSRCTDGPARRLPVSEKLTSQRPARVLQRGNSLI